MVKLSCQISQKDEPERIYAVLDHLARVNVAWCVIMTTIHIWWAWPPENNWNDWNIGLRALESRNVKYLMRFWLVLSPMCCLKKIRWFDGSNECSTTLDCNDRSKEANRAKLDIRQMVQRPWMEFAYISMASETIPSRQLCILAVKELCTGVQTLSSMAMERTNHANV